MVTIPQSDSYRDSGSCTPCYICGREVKAKNPWVIHVHDGGVSAVTEEEAATMSPASDLGLQFVGPECLRKHPELREYATKMREA